MSSSKLSYTPCSIAKDNALSFKIPLYQRLFEWGADQINQLIDDLHASYTRDPNAPYYIGMLTAKETGEDKELVDGQQRFTAMVLLGIYFKWDDFLSIKDKETYSPRLKFTAREEDEKYLESKLYRKPCEYVNDKMEKALSYIGTRIHKDINCAAYTNVAKAEKEFGNYIYNNLTFFLSTLPKEYSSNELNKYFERMNTSGKSLENYEILKVDILGKLEDNKERYSALWNAVSVMEKKILRKHKTEMTEALRNRYLSAILAINNGNINAKIIEDIDAKFEAEGDDEETESSKLASSISIREIDASSDNPYRIIKRRTEEHAILTFPEFLLQVLFISLDKNIWEKDKNGKLITDFFDVRKLGETFKWAFSIRNLNAKQYVESLIKYRLLMDYFTIRVDDEDEEPYPFELFAADEEPKGKVKQYMSMLYSASSAMTYYQWVPDLLMYLDNYVKVNKNLSLDAGNYLSELKAIDNGWHQKKSLEEEKDLTYNTIDRYWFWRFDYYLWDKRDIFFSAEDSKTAAKYIFRRNRSIEHIAPQHPKDEFGDKSKFYWDDDNHPDLIQYRDCIGNMVMISSGQNSTLSNSCFEVKKAVMDRYCKGYGHAESLKMLYIYSKYRDQDWSVDKIKEHDKFSKEFLDATYDDSKWSDIIKLHKGES